jgi:hypothetical protein
MKPPRPMTRQRLEQYRAAVVAREAARQERIAGRKQRAELSAEEKRLAKMRAPRREGLKSVAGWITPAMSGELRGLSAQSGRPVQYLVADAIALLLAKHETKPP